MPFNGVSVDWGERSEPQSTELNPQSLSYPRTSSFIAMPLHPEVRTAAHRCLVEVAKVWFSIPMLDHKRRVQWVDRGRTTVSLVRHRYITSFHEFHKLPLPGDSVDAFSAAVRANQPELCSGFVFSAGWSALGEPADLIRHWAYQLRDDAELEVEVRSLLDRVSDILSSRRLKQTVYMCLAGLTLHDDFPELEITPGTVLRRLSANEFERFASHDVLLGRPTAIEHAAVQACLVVEGYEGFELRALDEASNVGTDPSLSDTATEASRHLVRALNVLKSGQVTLCSGVVEGDRDLFPVGRFGFNWPWQFASSGIELVREDAPELLRLLERLTSCGREEVRIAADRLVDAQGRRSPVDSLVDCTVGLEVLLNPMDHAELSFRVALNYSYLWDEPHRRKRFDQLRDLQKTRNKIVHGGMRMSPNDAQLLSSQAEQAKRCLRDALQAFLARGSALSEGKLNADFWLERILPKQD